ncbi:MAG: YwiC-like family protein [Pyrinomonadaceae bacterium]
MNEVVLKNAFAPRVRVRSIALPVEHGAWGFLFEPIVASLAIAFSGGGVLIAVMCIGAFLARQPVKAYLQNRAARNDPHLAAAAIRFGLFYGAFFLAGLLGSMATAGLWPLVPFLAVIPLGAVQIYFDAAGQGRQLLPELLGALAISASAPAILLAGGFGIVAAGAFWLVFIARLIPSIIYVRERLRLEKGKSFSRIVPHLSHAAALVLVGSLAFFRMVPMLAAFAMAVLSFRAIEGLSSGRIKMKAMQIGIAEVVFGVVTAAALIIGHYSGI